MAVKFACVWFIWKNRFFNEHFLLFILASVVANHKTTTNADVLNKIAWVLKCAPGKIGAASCGKIADNDEWDWVFFLITVTEPTTHFLR